MISIMKNPLVFCAHKALKISLVYNTYQRIVGGLKANKRYLRCQLSSEQMSRKNSRITFVDLGCGPGVALEILPHGMNYLGVDISAEYVASAKNRSKKLGLDGSRISLLTGDVCDMNLELNNSNDAFLVSVNAIFHHLNDEQLIKLLANLYEQFPVGTKYVSQDPTVNSDTKRIAKWFAENDRGEYVRPSSRLEAFIMEAKFQEIEMSVVKNTYNIPLDIVQSSFRKC
jgi:SAM-dependent methyltransferase